MAKEKKASVKVTPSRKELILPWEESKWFTPVVFVVLFVALLILFREFIFSNRMLESSDMIKAGMFFRSYLVNFFGATGSVPQWNPYIYCGMPYVDAFHGDIFYPLSFIKYMMEIHRFLGMVMVIHIYLAGIFMYLCARQFKLSKTASLLSAIIYMFAASLVSLVSPGHDGKIYVATLFPLALMFLDRVFERKPFFNATVFGLIVGVIILTPHVQLAYYSMWALALYTIFKLVFLYREKKQIMTLARPGLLVCYGVVIGVLLSMIQFYPGYKYTTEFSPRADTKQGWDWAISWSMHEEEAFSALIPEFSGTNAQKEDSFYWGKNAFKDNSESSGAIGIFLALIAVMFTRRREAYFFAGLAILVFVYALGATTPVFKIFFWIVPLVKSLRAPSTIMFLFTFSVALLSGMTLQHLINGTRESDKSEKKFTYVLLGFPAFMGLLAVLFTVAGKGMLSTWSSIFYSEASTTLVQKGTTKLDVAYFNLPVIQTGAWIAFLVVAAVALCVWLIRSGKTGAGILLVVLCIPLLDNIRFDSRFIGTIDPNQHWGQTPITQYIKQDSNHYRALDITDIQGDVFPYHGIEVVVGYHGNQLRWYDDLLGGPGMTTLHNRNNPYNSRFLNLIGTGFLITPAGQDFFPAGFFGPKPVSAVTSTRNTQLLKNENAFPRVYLVNRFTVEPDRKNIYPRVINGTDDLRQVVYLEENPDITIPADLATGDSAWVVSYTPDSVVVGVKNSSNRILIMTDTYYDSWHVTVDSKPAKLLRAYGAFRAVSVPAGTNEVKFVYHSTRYTTGRLITWLTVLYIVVIIGTYTVIDRKKKKTPVTVNG